METIETWKLIVAIVATIFGASGFWTLILRLIDQKSAKTKLLIGLAHDRIVFIGEPIIKRGYITKDEYENLIKYLGEPYLKCHGNSYAEKIINDCKNLPIK